MGEEVVSKNFIEQEIDKDLAEGVYQNVCTRFPPEPKRLSSYWACKINSFKLWTCKKYNGTFHLRFDDTNPTKEDMEFVESIKKMWNGWGLTLVIICTMHPTILILCMNVQ